MSGCVRQFVLAVILAAFLIALFAVSCMQGTL